MNGCRHRKKSMIAFCLSVALILTCATPVFADGSGDVSASGVKTKTQTKWCLESSQLTSGVVKNKNFYVNAYTYGGGSRTSKNTIKTSKSDKKSATFRTAWFLPEMYGGSSIRNVQSFAFSTDGKYMYILSTTKADSTQGRVMRYDLELMKKYNISFDQLAKYAKSGTGALAKKLNECVKTGKQFTTGHGQSLALNPVTGELWEIQDMSTGGGAGEYATVQRINTRTLVPDFAIKFRLSPTVAMGHNMTFDKDGTAYFYTYSGGASKNADVKIYYGTISEEGVQFDIVKQGLNSGPGTHSQGLSYDAYRNRLMLVADGCLISVPVDKLGSLKPADVWQTQFKTKREFESVQFDAKGYAYLLTNRAPEILKSTTVY